MAEEYLVDIKNERLSFFTPAGEVKALNDVSIHLKEGEVLGIVGESGSGKSVTAYSLMGLTAHPGKLIGGTLQFNGHEIEDMGEKEMRKIRGKEISIIFQDPMTSLNPVYTIGNQITEVIRLHTDKDKKQAYARAKELLELVGINEPEKRLKQYPHELSGGMRQRVMIAIALACEPKLLIADEPTTALDVTIQAQILELMMELKDKLGMAIIMITHDLGVVASMCDRIAVMYAGRIVEYGTTDDIFYRPHHMYTKGLIRSIPRLDTKEHERLVPIEGTPVDLLNPPAGCPFAPRCEACMKICLREMPPVTQFDDVHYTQCWLNQKEAKDHGADKGGFLGSSLKDGDRVVMIEDVTTSGKSMEETVPKVKGAADVTIVGLMVSLNRMEVGKGGEKCALDEIKDLYGFDTAAIVTMEEVVECLYNKECNGKVVIDDTLKAAIDAYYEQYGAK